MDTFSWYITSVLQNEGDLDNSDDRTGDLTVEWTYPWQSSNQREALSPCQTGKNTFIFLDNLLKAKLGIQQGDIDSYDLQTI